MKFSCCVKNFRGVKFSRFRLIRKKILTVDGYNVDECLESLVYMYYQVLKSQVLLYIVVDRTFTSGGVDLSAHLFIDHHHVSFFSLV